MAADLQNMQLLMLGCPGCGAGDQKLGVDPVSGEIFTIHCGSIGRLNAKMDPEYLKMLITKTPSPISDETH